MGEKRLQSSDENLTNNQSPGIQSLSRKYSSFIILVIILLLFSTVTSLYIYFQANHTPALVSAFFSALGAGTTCYLYQYTKTNFLNPLLALRHWSTRMQENDFSRELPNWHSHEINLIYSDFNSIAAQLKSLSLDMQSQVGKQTMRIKQKTRSLETLYDVAASINGARDLEDLLTRFLHTLKTVVNARAGMVRILTDQDEMQLIASSGIDEEIVAQEKMVAIDRCLCGKAAQDGDVHTLENLDGCGQYAGRSFFNTDQVEMIAVPLRYRGKTLGIYNLFTEQKGLVKREDMKSLLTSIGHHLGMAIEKSRLDEEANLLSIMEERTRMANELHDSLAQSLASLRFQVRVLDETLHSGKESVLWEELERIENSIDEAYTELRELISHFRAPINKRGLIPAIQQAVERFRRDSQINAFLQMEWDCKPLPAETEIQVLRIVQEALANIRKHSNANAVRVIMRSLPENEFLVLVEDDGVGIQKQAPGGGPGEHIGLKILHERAARIGGILRIESESGEGTRITLNFTQKEEAPSTLTNKVDVSMPVQILSRQ
ncbi:MAG: histidine kinase [Gammaproteobacteria bacterium]